MSFDGFFSISQLSFVFICIFLHNRFAVHQHTQFDDSKPCLITTSPPAGVPSDNKACPTTTSPPAGVPSDNKACPITTSPPAGNLSENKARPLLH